MEKLRTRHDELINLDEDDWTEDLAAEAEAVEARLDEIEAKAASRARFKPEDFAIAGCIATVGRDGSAPGHSGLGQARGHAAAGRGVDGAERWRRGRGARGRFRQRGREIVSPARRFRRPCGRPGTARRKRARRQASASGSPTTSARSGPPWSRRIWPATSRPPSTSCCSRWAARCSPRAITTTPSTSPSARPPTGRRCGCPARRPLLVLGVEASRVAKDDASAGRVISQKRAAEPTRSEGECRRWCRRRWPW